MGSPDLVTSPSEGEGDGKIAWPLLFTRVTGCSAGGSSIRVWHHAQASASSGNNLLHFLHLKLGAPPFFFYSDHTVYLPGIFSGSPSSVYA